MSARLPRFLRGRTRLSRPAWDVSHASRIGWLRKSLAVALAGLAAAAVATAIEGCAGPAAPSALLVIVDTARADRFGAYGYADGATPFLDGLERSGWVRFERATAQSPWTLPSVASLFTSLSPPAHGVGQRAAEGEGRVTFTALRPGVPTAPEILRDTHGFRTAAFMSNPALDPDFGLGRGFELYDQVGTHNLDTRSAREVVDAGLAWLGERAPDERFFLVLHMNDPHLYYDPPAEHAAKLLSGERVTARPHPHLYERLLTPGERPGPGQQAWIEALYDAELAFVDSELERLVDGLEALGRGATTAIVVTSDHGEEFWDHGGFEHGHSLHQELLRLPLWLRLPDRAEARRPRAEAAARDQIVRHVDIAPSLFDVLELPAAAGFRGRSLFAEHEDPAPTHLGYPLYGQMRGLLSGTLKLVEAGAEAEIALYDLAADPHERHDLAPGRPADVARLHAELEALEAELARVSDTWGALRADPLEPALFDRLQAIGYIP